MVNNNQLKGFISFLFDLRKTGQILLMQAAYSRKEEISDENVFQMERGEDPFGDKFKDYSEASVVLYGKEAGPIKWKDTGDFHESIEVEKQGVKTLIIGATDPKFKEFIEPIAEPLGLQEVSLENEIIDLVVDDFMELLLKELDQKIGK